ncbi:HEAT repeat domain-containing protein [bacterium]|nr:HEAT repeat domain-containing protein [bacterium]MBU3956480.1 HEAT repeat domain-containing protein [bacterium]
MKRIIKVGVFLFLVIALNEVGFAEETAKEKNLREKSTVQKSQPKQLSQKELEKQMEEDMIRKYRPKVEENVKKLEDLFEKKELYDARAEFTILDLARARDARAVPILAKILLEYKLDDERTIDRLPSAEVRKMAANAIGMIGDKSAILVLKEALGDEDGEVILSAIKSLGEIGEKEVVSILKEIEIKNDKKIGIWIGNALIQAGDKKEGFSKLREWKSSGLLIYFIRKGIVKYEEVKDIFLYVLEKGEDEYERISCAFALSEFGNSVDKNIAFKSAVNFLRNKNIKVLNLAVSTLRNTGRRDAIPYLEKLLERDDISYVENTARRALDRLYEIYKK